uniref:Uncharacterized protein n=1 Tax=Rhizophora mucronata TaxID=61149 RepID=A0A2P2NJF0_RHIMU
MCMDQSFFDSFLIIGAAIKLFGEFINNDANLMYLDLIFLTDLELF